MMIGMIVINDTSQDLFCSVFGVLPVDERARRLVLALTAYIDDSGGRGYSPVFVLAGYLASVERWADFSLEWRALLDEAGLPAFHTSQVWRLEWRLIAQGPLRRDRLLVRAVDCIRRHAERAFVVSVGLDAHAHWFDAGDAKIESMSERFTATFCLCTLLYQYAYRNHYNQTLEVVFDEGIDGSPLNFIAAFDFFRDLAKRHFSGLTVPYPVFRSDKDVLPLQAADLLAWLARRDALNVSKRRDRSFLPEKMLLDDALDMPRDVRFLGDEELEPMSYQVMEGLIQAIPGLFDKLPTEVKSRIISRRRR